MMVLVDAGRLEARDAVADVHPLHQPELRQRVEDTVDAGDPDRAAFGDRSRAAPARWRSSADERVARAPPSEHRRSEGRRPAWPRGSCRASSSLNDSRSHRRARLLDVRIVLILALVLGLSACGGSDEGSGSDRTVIAAFYPLAYAAERVAAPAPR